MGLINFTMTDIGDTPYSHMILTLYSPDAPKGKYLYHLNMFFNVGAVKFDFMGGNLNYNEHLVLNVDTVADTYAGSSSICKFGTSFGQVTSSMGTPSHYGGELILEFHYLYDPFNTPRNGRFTLNFGRMDYTPY